jgi:hypothetical protein
MTRQTRAERQAAMVQAAQPAIPQVIPLKVERPATERIAALMELRRLKGLIVPSPKLLPVDDSKNAYQQEQDHKANAQTILAWLTEIADKGAGQDVEAAWLSLTTHKRLKEELFDQRTTLKLRADRSFYKLEQAAQAEETAARRVWQRQQDIEQLKKLIEASKKTIADCEKRLADLTA